MPYCPCCRSESGKFLPYGLRPRPNARCPRCGSLERHRLLWLFLTGREEMLSASTRLLHIAPEPILSTLLRSSLGSRYVSADLGHTGDVRLDVTALPFRHDTFDAVICNHVLEHVPDDRSAMREFRRILRTPGWAILESPVNGRLEKTYEDPAIVDPAERERAFGQFDHVRVYGRDFQDRLREAGFDLEPATCAALAEAGSVARYALSRHVLSLCHPRCT